MLVMISVEHVVQIYTVYVLLKIVDRVLKDSKDKNEDLMVFLKHLYFYQYQKLFPKE